MTANEFSLSFHDYRQRKQPHYFGPQIRKKVSRYLDFTPEYFIMNSNIEREIGKQRMPEDVKCSDKLQYLMQSANAKRDQMYQSKRLDFRREILLNNSILEAKKKLQIIEYQRELLIMENLTTNSDFDSCDECPECQTKPQFCACLSVIFLQEIEERKY